MSQDNRGTEAQADCERHLTELVEREGLLQASLNASGELTVKYDLTRLAERDVSAILDRVEENVTSAVEQCQRRLSGGSCEDCSKTRATDAPARQVGMISRRVMVPSTATSGIAQSIWQKAYQSAEPICTTVCLVTMVTGLLAPRIGISHQWQMVLYTISYLSGGWFGVTAAWESLRNRLINIDLLMVVAALGAASIGAPFEGAMLLFLFSLSNVLQKFAMERARNAIGALMKLRPSAALVKTPDGLRTVAISKILPGQTVVVRPGERIPLDARVLTGASSVNESVITGESIPREKQAGDMVLAGSINATGSLEVEVLRGESDSFVARLIQMVEQAQAEKAQTQTFLDRAEQRYAAAVLAGTALLILVPWLLLGGDFGPVFYRAMTVMVVASPCALIISTPASILSAIAGAARKGVLFKGGAHLERTAEIKIVAFDKTGTLTVGKPDVTNVMPLPAAGLSTEELLRLAAAVESKSEHPLAQAILARAASEGIGIEAPNEFTSITGMGATAWLPEGRQIAVGSMKLMQALECDGLEEAQAITEQLEDEGKTCVGVAQINPGRPEVLGVIAVADQLRPEAAEAIANLRRNGIAKVVMLTGDSPRVARAVARSAGVDDWFAGLLPEDKVTRIAELTKTGPVAMVGDGINDAPALARASVGIAMGAAGTDVALETADIVLMSNDLNRLPFLFSLSRRARAIIIENLVFAGCMIVFLVIAALGFYLPLPLGVVGHEGSTVLVCLNGLRLLAARTEGYR